MKWGAWGCRADERGLGRITADVFTHLHPDRVAVIDMGEHARGFTQRFDLYGPGATIVPFGGGTIDADIMRRWCDGLDLALTVETPYDARFYDIARDVGCRTVLMTMPEFARPEHSPDVTWAPTVWRLDQLPPATRVVPVPVALDRFPPPGPRRPGPLRVLHVAGHRAAQDRNGTLTFLRALRTVRAAIEVRVVTQDSRLPHWRALRHIAYRAVLGGVADYRDLYGDADVLVLPRRYGGLSLVAAEACAAGLALVMPDVSPNRETWPIITVRAQPAGEIATPGGQVGLWNPSVGELAATIEWLTRDPGSLAEARAASRRWAEQNSWEALEATWRAELERAAHPGG